jgi:hypothetical protein
MFATRASRWGAVAVLIVVVGSLVYGGAALAQGTPSFHPDPARSGYNATFDETGLAAGTHWTVTVYGHGSWWHGFRASSKSSASSTILFPLRNGTYHYLVHAVYGYNITSGAYGSFIVNGSSPAPVLVTFAKLPTYTVTFSESGLAAGTNWTVIVTTPGEGPWGLGGAHFYERGSGTTLTFSLLNGTYHYAVLGVAGYSFVANSSHGRFNVTGASPATIDVKFAALPTYDVSFVESGLPASTNWTVLLFLWHGWAAGPRVVLLESSDTTTITVALTSGTYGYLIGEVDGYYVSSGVFGHVTVAGASPPAISVTFEPRS